MYGAQPTVTIDAIRVEIGDQPHLCVLPGAYETVSPGADGVQTAFPLRFRKARLPTVRVWTSTLTPNGQGLPPVRTPVAANDAALGWNATVDANGLPEIVFNLPPAAGTVVLARYDVTMFTDSEILTYLPDNVRSTAALTLKAVHYAMIPVMLADREAGIVARIYERTDDPSQWMRTQLEIRKQLAADLDNEPGEGPAAGLGSGYCGIPYVL